MLSDWLSITYFLAIPITIAIGGVFLVRRFMPNERLRRHNDIAAPIHATIAVIYAVLLAFVTVIVWEQFNNAEETVAKEANQIAALDRDVHTFPAEIRTEIQTALQRYTVSVINDEWKLMREGSMDGFRSTTYPEIWNKVQSFNPKDERERVWLSLVYQQLNKLDESRSNRIVYVERAVPQPIWGLLIIGGLITLLFTCFFGAEERKIHLYMICTLAFVIGIMLFMIAEIDRPFTGIVSVDPEPFHHTLETLKIVR